MLVLCCSLAFSTVLFCSLDSTGNSTASRAIFITGALALGYLLVSLGVLRADLLGLLCSLPSNFIWEEVASPPTPSPAQRGRYHHDSADPLRVTGHHSPFSLQSLCCKASAGQPSPPSYAASWPAVTRVYQLYEGGGQRGRGVASLQPLNDPPSTATPGGPRH